MDWHEYCWLISHSIVSIPLAHPVTDNRRMGSFLPENFMSPFSILWHRICYPLGQVSFDQEKGRDKMTGESKITIEVTDVQRAVLAGLFDQLGISRKRGRPVGSKDSEITRLRKSVSQLKRYRKPGEREKTAEAVKNSSPATKRSGPKS